MSCPLHNLTLESVTKSSTWDGLTFTITASDDTRYAAALARVRMTWKNGSGTAVLTLDSDVPGEITLTATTAYAWSFTAEPVVLNLDAGWYSWAAETTDADGIVIEDLIAGVHQIKNSPHT